MGPLAVKRRVEEWERNLDPFCCFHKLKERCQRKGKRTSMRLKPQESIWLIGGFVSHIIDLVSIFGVRR